MLVATDELLELLDYLAAERPEGGAWRQWHIARIGGGANNLLYRATGDARDLAVKWTIRDERDRAGRELLALLALRGAGLAVAPEPIYLERKRYPLPVIVQSWLPGEVRDEPPDGDQEWRRLLEHYIAIWSIAPGGTALPIRNSVHTMRCAADGVRLIERQLALLPGEARPPALDALLRLVARLAPPERPAPATALCRSDPNILNFVRGPAAWASVDWENSGWGDPAFEIADTMAHPAFAGVPAARWGWLIDGYCELRGEPGGAVRVRTYYRLMLVWWAARLARLLYEVPRGGDQRLAARPDGWLDDVRAKYERYLALALAAWGG